MSFLSESIINLYMVRRNYKDPSVQEPFVLGDFFRFSLIFFFLGDHYCFYYKFAAITSVIPDMKQLRKWRNKKNPTIVII